MNWYYAVNNEQRGPVDVAELSRLHAVGVVTPVSLVWREGMTEWQPYQAAMGTAAPPPLSSASVGGVMCAECGKGFPPDQVIRLGNVFTCAACKPIVLQKMSEGVIHSTAETIRKDHIKHEASIKSVGILYFLGAGMLLLAGLGMGVSAFALEKSVELIVGGVVFLAFAAGLITAGIGVRSLKPWGRIMSGVLSGIGLLGFPVGTLINGYILYLLFSSKGKMVFSDEYKGIIAETPHVKYRTSIVVWIVAGFILLAILAALILPALARHH